MAGMKTTSAMALRGLRAAQKYQSRGNVKEDKDRVLSDEQRNELRTAFRMFEKSGSRGKGKISIRDFGELLRCLGWNPSEIEIEEARHELDSTGTGMVMFNDVEDYVARKGVLVDQSSAEDILAAFQVLGKNGSGRIPADEFKFFMTTMGEKMSPEEVDELMKEADKKGTGSILYEEFLKSTELNDDAG